MMKAALPDSTQNPLTGQKISCLPILTHVLLTQNFKKILTIENKQFSVFFKKNKLFTVSAIYLSFVNSLILKLHQE